MSVHEEQAVWRSTGLHWESGQPVLAATPANPPIPPPGQACAERRRTVGTGHRIAWTLHGPRRCTGIWTGTGHRPCPARASLADSTDPQCFGCAAADRGRALARDAISGDDGRTYHLYLALFGPGLVKVGLTAADRGWDRLLEQGAITCTLLATGPYLPVRQAELLIAGTQLARERISSRAKAAAWWDLPPATERTRQITSARHDITARITWPSGTELLPCAVTDHTACFGLDEPVPTTYREVTGLGSQPELAGEIRFIIGRRVLLDTASGPLLVDMRRLAGLAFTASTGHATAGFTTVTRTRHGDRHASYDTLF